MRIPANTTEFQEATPGYVGRFPFALCRRRRGRGNVADPFVRSNLRVNYGLEMSRKLGYWERKAVRMGAPRL
jgi:hypothetical protein